MELPQARNPEPEETDCVKGKIFFPLIDNGNGEVKSNFFLCFMHGFRQRELHMERFSDSLPSRARNRAAASFLNSDCEYLLFVDADIVFTKENIDDLMQSDEPILAGLYCKKEKGIAPCINTFPDMKPTDCGGYIPIKRAGTGFLRIHRKVLEKMKQQNGERNPPWTQAKRYVNHGRPEWDFFECGVVEGEYLSEDWYFCDRARALGYQIILDSRIQLRHEGAAIYPIEETVQKNFQENNGVVADRVTAIPK